MLFRSAVYLIVLALIPPRWPGHRRRAAAVLASPILIALVEPGFIGPSGNALYAASFVVGAIACGLAARLETRAGPAGAGASRGTVSAF